MRAERDGFGGYVVPVDACYELVGPLRIAWRGFDGGTEARTRIAEFFDRIHARCRPRGGGHRSSGGGGSDVTKLDFSVLDIRPEPYAAAPALAARLQVTEHSGEQVHAMALRCQLRIEPRRRAYSDAEKADLGDLFGPAGPLGPDAPAAAVGAGLDDGARLLRRDRGRTCRCRARTTSTSRRPSTCTRSATATCR